MRLAFLDSRVHSRVGVAAVPCCVSIVLRLSDFCKERDG